jgi:hypothetical protein
MLAFTGERGTAARCLRFAGAADVHRDEDVPAAHEEAVGLVLEDVAIVLHDHRELARCPFARLLVGRITDLGREDDPVVHRDLQAGDDRHTVLLRPS